MDNKYHLYRGKRRVASQQSAGKLHDLGKTGDVLVCWDKRELCVFRWNAFSHSQQRYWLPGSEEDLHPELRLSLLLET